MADGRMRRVDEAVREVLSDTITRDLKDPRVGFVTVTAVRTSRDLRHARVYVSVLGDVPARAATLEGLRSAQELAESKLGGITGGLGGPGGLGADVHREGLGCRLRSVARTRGPAAVHRGTDPAGHPAPGLWDG